MSTNNLAGLKKHSRLAFRRQLSLTKSMKTTRLLSSFSFIAFALPAHASVLLFEGTFINIASSDYGDRVTATTMTSGTEVYNYGSLHGFTPNVTLDIGNNPALWGNSFGDLTGVVYPAYTTSPSLLTLVFTADPGYNVRLHGFDLGGWPTTDYTINSVEIQDGVGNPIFEQTNATIAGTGPSHTSFDFATPLEDDLLVLTIDSSNLGIDSDNIGLDNVAFSQVVIPEPAAAPLTGLLALLLARRRS